MGCKRKLLSLAIFFTVITTTAAVNLQNHEGQGCKSHAFNATTTRKGDPAVHTVRIEGEEFLRGELNNLSFTRSGLLTLTRNNVSRLWRVVGETQQTLLGYTGDFGDFNGDGIIEIVVTASSRMLFYRHNGSTFTLERVVERSDVTIPGINARFPGDSLAVGDFNGDGYDDLLIGEPLATPILPPGRHNGALYIFLGGPEGVNFSSPWWSVVGDREAFMGCVIGCVDVNGDGYDDVVSSANETYLLYLSSPGGPSRTPDWKPYTRYKNVNWTSIVFGDFNGDRRPSLVVAVRPYGGEPGEIQVYCGVSGIFTYPPILTLKEEDEDNFPGDVAVGDFDSDGHDDLAVSSLPGTVHVYRGRRSGSYPYYDELTEVQVLNSEEEGVTFGEVLISAEVDGDEGGDLLVSSQGHYILFRGGWGQGNEPFNTSATFEIDLHPSPYHSIRYLDDGLLLYLRRDPYHTENFLQNVGLAEVQSVCYPGSGFYMSHRIDTESNGSIWLNLTMSTIISPDVFIKLYTRSISGTGGEPNPWREVEGGRVLSPRGRYIQILAVFGTGIPTKTPAMKNITLTYFLNSPPEVRLEVPSEGAFASGLVELRWNYSDPEGDSQRSWKVEVLVGDILPEVVLKRVGFGTEDHETLNLSLLPEGSVYIRLSTSDVWDAWSIPVTRRVLLDITPPEKPVVETSTLSPGMWVNKSRVEVAWEAEDTLSGTAGYSVVLDPSPETTPPPRITHKKPSGFFTLTPGVNYLHVRAVDRAGNWGDTLTYGPLLYDPFPPEITAVMMEHLYGNVTFSWSAYDNTSSIAMYRYSLLQSMEPTGPGENLTGDLNATFRVVDEGTYYFHLWAYDLSGNSIHTVFSFRVYLPVPVIVNVTPVKEGEDTLYLLVGSWEGGSAYGFEWRSSLDGLLSRNSTFLERLSPGRHTISFRVLGEWGWSEWANTTLNVSAPASNSPPTIKNVFVLPSPETVAGEEIAVYVEAIDPDGDSLEYHFDFGDGNVSGWSSSPIQSHVYSTPGNYTMKVTVRDPHGLMASRTVRITVISENSDREGIPPEGGGGDGRSADNVLTLILISVIAILAFALLYTQWRARGSITPEE